MPYRTLCNATIIIVIRLVTVISTDSSIQPLSEVLWLLARVHFGVFRLGLRPVPQALVPPHSGQSSRPRTSCPGLASAAAGRGGARPPRDARKNSGLRGTGVGRAAARRRRPRPGKRRRGTAPHTHPRSPLSPHPRTCFLAAGQRGGAARRVVLGNHGAASGARRRGAARSGAVRQVEVGRGGGGGRGGGAGIRGAAAAAAASVSPVRARGSLDCSQERGTPHGTGSPGCSPAACSSPAPNYLEVNPKLAAVIAEFVRFPGWVWGFALSEYGGGKSWRSAVVRLLYLADMPGFMLSHTLQAKT